MFENHVSFEGDEACALDADTSVAFENHVSFEGDEANALPYVLEQFV